jgi:hypothetical protein
VKTVQLGLIIYRSINSRQMLSDRTKVIGVIANTGLLDLPSITESVVLSFASDNSQMISSNSG